MFLLNRQKELISWQFNSARYFWVFSADTLHFIGCVIGRRSKVNIPMTSDQREQKNT